MPRPLEILPRTIWLPATFISAAPSLSPLGILIHHSVSSNRQPAHDQQAANLAAINWGTDIHRLHVQGNRWADIGYNFLVSRDGLILEGRASSLAAAQSGRVRRGAHAGDNTANTRWFGVCLEGDYRTAAPPPIQLVAAAHLCGHLAHWGSFDTQKIGGHRDVRATECPGASLYSLLPAVRGSAHGIKVALRSP